MPIAESSRIESLDVLRGFALLGILLLNILGFGLYSGAYSNPGFDVDVGLNADLITWASVEMLAEGAMRCLFSMLFGAGVLLFTTGAAGKGGALHYKRTFWLLVFGLIDAYLLLWNGDILITYAIGGALLYWLRNASARKLFIVASVLIVLISGFHALVRIGLMQGQEAALKLDAMTPEQVAEVDDRLKASAEGWRDFAIDYLPTPEGVEAEYAARRGSYASAFRWNMETTNGMLMFVVPVFLLWDSLAMMLLGMAFYKAGILQGEKSTQFYRRLIVAGFAIGLVFNGYEVTRAIANDLELQYVFGQMQWTYHIGRLGMAVGYLGLILWFCNSGALPLARRLLAAVGRMALTNYLMHSLICAVIFTGLGFALVGHLSRAELYPFVFAIWAFQLWFSQWWLARYHYGPVEWLWRALTYGNLPNFRRRARAGEG